MRERYLQKILIKDLTLYIQPIIQILNVELLFYIFFKNQNIAKQKLFVKFFLISQYE